MTPGKRRLPGYLLLPLLIAGGVAVIAGGNHLLKNEIRDRIREVDPLASFSEVGYGVNTIFIGGLLMPGRGISAESVWVSIRGGPFNPYPSRVDINGVIITPGDRHGSGSGDGPDISLPPLSIEGGTLPDGTLLFASRRGNIDHISMEGSWGTLLARGENGIFTAVFHDVTGVPLEGRPFPGVMGGRSVSGVCTGTLSRDTVHVRGTITALDGEPASASFSYRLMNGVSEASFDMDFSRISRPAIAFLSGATGGAVISAAPSGSLHVSMGEADSLFFSTVLNIDSLVVFSEAIAPDTFSIGIGLECAGYLLPGTGSLSIHSGIIRVEEAEAGFNLDLGWSARRRMALNIFSRSLSGEAITASVPPELLGCLRGLSLAGELSFSTGLILDWDHPESCDVSIDIDPSRLLVSYSPVSFANLMDSAVGGRCSMRDSWGNSRVIALDTLHNDLFVVYDSMPVFFEPLLRCAEDASFRRHSGFSEYHIRNSIRADMESRRFVRGGSTITMQLAKNLFLGREKTLARKLQEVFLTWRLERWLSKDRIVELYANIVELGPGVFGFNSAGLYYFGKPFSGLSLRETAFLVSILPGPRIYHSYGLRGELPAHWNSYVERLISICGNRGWIDEDLVEEALGDTLVFRGTVSRGGMVDNGGSQNY